MFFNRGQIKLRVNALLLNKTARQNALLPVVCNSCVMELLSTCCVRSVLHFTSSLWYPLFFMLNLWDSPLPRGKCSFTLSFILLGITLYMVTVKCTAHFFPAFFLPIGYNHSISLSPSKLSIFCGCPARYQ